MHIWDFTTNLRYIEWKYCILFIIPLLINARCIKIFYISGKHEYAFEIISCSHIISVLCYLALWQLVQFVIFCTLYGNFGNTFVKSVVVLKFGIVTFRQNNECFLIVFITAGAYITYVHKCQEYVLVLYIVTLSTTVYICPVSIIIN